MAKENILLQPFTENWRKKRFPLERTVLLAVSGGGDSMAMAVLCYQAGIKFSIAHVNFGLRGAESDGDEALVREWAEAHTIPFHVYRPDVEQAMKDWKCGVQEAARRLRYNWFTILLKEHRYAAVATAHHAADNAETVLMHLLKGTGLKGMQGIPEQHGKVFRPLLFASKEQIDAYVATQHVPYRNDSSNATDKYLRNRVRQFIIPALEKEFPAAVHAVATTAAHVAGAAFYYKTAIEKVTRKLVDQRGRDWYIPVRRLLQLSYPETILMECLAPYGFDAVQMQDIMRLTESISGKQVHSETHTVLRNREHLIITARDSVSSDFMLIESLPATVRTADGTFYFRIVAKPEAFPADRNVVYLSLAMAALPLALRRPRTGDYLYPFGMSMKKKKLSRLLIDLKIPLHQKARLWLLECNRQVLWVGGIRADERSRVRPHEKDVLEVRFTAAQDA